MEIKGYGKVSILTFICLFPMLSFAQSEFSGNWKGKIVTPGLKQLGECEIAVQNISDPESVEVTLTYTGLKGQDATPMNIKGKMLKYTDSDDKALQLRHTLNIDGKKYNGLLLLSKADNNQKGITGQFVTIPDQKYLDYYWIMEQVTPGGGNAIVAPAAANSPVNAATGFLAPNVKVLDIDKFLFITKGSIGINKGSKYAIIDADGNFIIPWGKYSIPEQFNSSYSKYGVILVADNDQVNHLLSPEGKVLFSSKNTINFNLLGFALVGFYPDLKVINSKGQEVTWLTRICNKRSDYKIQYKFELDNRNIELFRPDVERMLVEKTVTDTISMVDAKKAAGVKHIQHLEADKVRAVHISWGYVNMSGKETIPFRPYLYARPFYNGMAAVCKKDEFNIAKWGYINEKGEEVIPFQFTNEPGPFNSGLAMVRPASSAEIDYAYINKSGNVVYTIPKQRLRKDGYLLLGEGQGASVTSMGTYVNGYTIQHNGIESQYYLVDSLGNRKDLTAIINGHNFATYPGAYPMVQDYNLNGIYFRAHNKTMNGNAYGILNYDGSVRVPPHFNYARILLDPLSDLAVALQYEEPEKNNNKMRTGVINKQGLYIIIKGEESKW